MKNLSIAAVLITLLLSGCYYEDGPIISLRTPEARLINKWDYQKVIQNGNDITSSFSGSWIEFKKDKSATFYENATYSYYAFWEFDDDYKILYLDCSDDSGNYWTMDMEILKLRNKEIWMVWDAGAVTTRFELVQY